MGTEVSLKNSKTLLDFLKIQKAGANSLGKALSKYESTVGVSISFAHILNERVSKPTKDNVTACVLWCPNQEKYMLSDCPTGNILRPYVEACGVEGIDVSILSSLHCFIDIVMFEAIDRCGKCNNGQEPMIEEEKQKLLLKPAIVSVLMAVSVELYRLAGVNITRIVLFGSVPSKVAKNFDSKKISISFACNHPGWYYYRMGGVYK